MPDKVELSSVSRDTTSTDHVGLTSTAFYESKQPLVSMTKEGEGALATLAVPVAAL